MSSFIIVTIDGGAASGKSSTARRLSEQFNLLHVDTGAFYRTITLALLEAGVSPGAEEQINDTLPKIPLRTAVQERSGVMELNGRVPAQEIRTPPVNETVSLFSASPAVREFLLHFQRGQADVAREAGFRGLVMEGRDIGSVIFPDADFRFFLTADETERQRRRTAQGQMDAIEKRDQLDSGRKNAPLRRPSGAIEINSNTLSLEEVVEKMSQHIDSKSSAQDER